MLRKINENIYIIQSGDTLSEIAKKNNSTIDTLVNLNNIQDPDKIDEGGELILPEKE